MSEFECSCGHIMPSSWRGICKICGSRTAYMDGKSRNQLAKEEEYERDHDNKQEEVEEND